MPQISISLYVTLNKVILGFISGAVQTGYFDSSDRIVRLIFSVFIAISTVMLPRMSSFYSLKEYDKISSFTHVILVLSVWLVLPLIFGIIANTSMIVLVLLGQAYAPMKIVLKLSALILLPMSIANVLGNQILIPMNRVGKYTISVIAGAVINLLIDFPLIISWGAQGAAIASIISETVVAACQIIFCLDMLKKFEFSWEIIKAFVVAVILFPSTILLMTLFKSTVILTLVFSIVVAGIYMLLTARIPVKLIRILKKMT
ncbi:polysaccharide biosynthesis C-terminal domain-containing protein [Lactiplantibacillus plantarum]